MWMENLQKNPSKFLANKLQIQVNKQKLLHTPEQTGHRFRLYPDTLSVLIRTPIPG